MIDVAVGCAGKVAFINRSLAKAAARRRPGREVYRCEHCGLLHVGTHWKASLKNRQRKRGRGK